MHIRPRVGSLPTKKCMLTARAVYLHGCWRWWRLESVQFPAGFTRPEHWQPDHFRSGSNVTMVKCNGKWSTTWSATGASGDLLAQKATRRGKLASEIERMAAIGV